MFLLILLEVTSLITEMSFTFHNVSINSASLVTVLK